MKKSLAVLLILMTAVSFMPVNAYALSRTLAADGTWASSGVPNAATALIADAVTGDAVNISTNNTLTITDNNTATDGGGVNTFSLGAITNSGTNNALVDILGNTTADDNLTVTIASANIGSNFTVRNVNNNDGNVAATVSGALTVGGTTNVTSAEATDDARTVALTVTGNFASTGITTVTANVGGGTGSNSTLTLNGATNSSGNFVLDSNTGIATLTVGGTATTTTVTGIINGSTGTEGVLNVTGDGGGAADTTTFASIIGGTQLLADINIGTAGATTTAFSSNVSATNMDIQNASFVSFAASADYAGVLDFESLGTATLATGADITGTVTSNATNNQGTLIFNGTSSISGDVGTAAATDLLLITQNGTGTVTFNGDVWAETTNFAANGTIALGTGDDLSSATISTTAGTGTGAITTAGTSTIGRAASTIGATGARLASLTTATATTTTVTGASAFIDATTISGTGTLAVTGALDWTGTSINFAGAGTMTATANSDIAANITNTTTNNGTLTLADGAHTLTGNFGSTGAGLAAINIGTGTTALTGDLKATGILFSAGGGNVLTLADGSDLTIGASHFSVTDDGTGTITFLTGSHVTSGAGTIGIAGTNDLLAANFNGAVTLGNSLAAITSTVNTGGTLTMSGNRAIVGALTLAGSGILDLGTSTLTHTGIVLATAANTFKTTVSGATLGNIVTSGVAVPTNGTIVDVTVAGALTSGTALTVLNGAAGMDKTITVNDNSARYSFVGAFTGATGDLTITPTFISSSTLTTSANTASVGAIFDATTTTATGDFLTVQNAINALPTSDSLDAAYATLDPEVSGDAAQGSFNAMSQSLGAYTSHLDNVRSGVNAGETGYSFGDGFRNTTFWIKGFGNTIDQDTHKGVTGYEAATGGVAAGFDGLVNDKTRLGLGGGWAYTDADGKAATASSSTVNSYSGTAYYTYNEEPWYVDGAFSFAWNAYEASRRIAFTGIDRTANADYDGQQYTGLLGGGYVIKQNQWEITYLGSLQYSHLALEKYTETGADSLNLAVNSQDYDFLQSGLGIKLAYPIKNDAENSGWLRGTWIPEVHAKWLYDFIGDKVQTTSSFTGGGASFSTDGLDPEQSSFNLGTGVTFYSKGNTSFILGYDAELKSDYLSHSGTLTMKVQY